MKQKTIREVVKFILILFLFIVIKLEGSNVKLVKVREFNSYEEYERWRDKVKDVKKPSKITVDKGLIIFRDDKGRVIKEKKYRYLSHEERISIVEREIKRDMNEKEINIYYEDAKVLSSEKGVLLEKVTSYYEGGKSAYEIFDEKGNKIGEINENVEIYPSPDGKYFVGLYLAIYEVLGEIVFFSRTGKLWSKSKIFDFAGMERNIIFSYDGEYVIFTLNERSKSGVAFLNRNGEILKIKVSDNWVFPLGKRFIINKKEWIVFPSISEGYKNLESYTFDGVLRWKYIVGRDVDITYCFDGKDAITVISYPLTRIGEIPTNFTLHIIDADKGVLKKKITFSNEYLGDPIDLSTSFKNNFILLTSINRISSDKIIRMVHLMDKNGGRLWTKEFKDGDSLNAEFDDEGRVVIKEGEKVFLYEVK